VGSATNKGAEVSIQYRILPQTTVSFDAQYLDASYDHFLYDTPASSGPPATSCPFQLNSAMTFYTIDCSGRRTLRSPKWSLNAGIEQSVDIGDFTLTGNFNTHYQTSSMIGFEMLSTQLQDSYFLSNASIRLSPRSGTWSLTGFVNNIENNRPLGSVFVNSAAGVIGGAVGAPRTYGLQASASF
jgi:iron complex outermembrane receptor protein